MWASEAPCSSILKNQMKPLKPGHHIAKILLFRTHHLWNSTTELILLCMSRKFRHIIVQPFGICSENLTTRNDIRWSQLLLRAIPTGILLKIRCRLLQWQKSDKKSSKITKTKYRKRNRGTLSFAQLLRSQFYKRIFWSEFR